MAGFKRELPLPRFVHNGQERGGAYVINGGKAPKRRFEPYQFLRFQRGLFEIICCYRMQDRSSEWMYCLETRQQLPNPGTPMPDNGCGSAIPRVVTHLFGNRFDAHNYLADIPANGDRREVTNQMLLQHGAEVISSRQVRSVAVQK